MSKSVATTISKAKTLAKNGKTDNAIQLFLEVIKKFPNNASAKSALREIGKRNEKIVKNPPREKIQSILESYKKQLLKDALLQARTTIKSFPYSPYVWNMRGVISAELGQFEEAEASLKNVIKLSPTNAEAYSNLGNILMEQRKLDDAISFYRVSIAFNSKFSTAHQNLGLAYREQGQIPEARKCFMNAIQADPNFGSAYRNLSLITDFSEASHLAQQIADGLKIEGLSDYERSEFLFAHAKACEDLEKYEDAYFALELGGQLKQKIMNYSYNSDADAFSAASDWLEQLPTIEFSATKSRSNPVPVFILGMPRSGTTLVEQIISSHSLVDAGGELPTVQLLAKRFLPKNFQLQTDVVQHIREAYFREVSSVSKGAPVLTDKMPQNFFHIALIRKAFPESKIVLVSRDPKATCWSNFSQCFQDKKMGFSFNLEDTVNYFLEFSNLMQKAKERFREEVYDLNYEALTQSPQLEITKLLEYLDLPIEARCFAPQENQNVARTASQLQVQKPIYQGNSGAWKKFEKWAGQTFERLES